MIVVDCRTIVVDRNRNRTRDETNVTTHESGRDSIHTTGTNCPFEHEGRKGLLAPGGRPPQTAHRVIHGECLAGLFVS